jgi:hypothetical protein
LAIQAYFPVTQIHSFTFFGIYWPIIQCFVILVFDININFLKPGSALSLLGTVF